MINRRRFIAGIGMGFILETVPNIHLLKENLNSVNRLSGSAFGTTWQLTIPQNSSTADAIKVCNSVIDKVNQSLSPWQKNSEISAFNISNSTDWISVSEACSNVITSALNIASLSTGYFDPTVGPLVARSGFGPISSTVDQPDYTQIDARPRAIRKNQSWLTLDPCGIAKGYALDLIVEGLLEHGISDHFLEIGGEIRTSGQHPKGRHWIAGIESPVGDNSELAYHIRLKDQALATSSAKRNSFNTGKRVISHIIDPRSEAPADNALLAVSVIADTAMLADGWATALMASGVENAMNLAKANNLPSLLMMKSTKNTVEYKTVVDFENYLL